MCPLLLYSHLANTDRILSAFCQLVQDFSGRSFHYMGIGKEADVVEQHPKDSSTKWGIKEQSLTLQTTTAVFAAPLKFCI